MSRYIDADAMKTKKTYSHERHEYIVPVAEIDWMPTVDAVQVVRCGECENWDTEYSSGRKSLGNYRCVCHEWSNEEDGFYRYTAEDDYCSYGERRTE
jgi:hypothetical protein